MNYPDDFNSKLFDHTIGTRLSDAKEVLDAHKHQVHDAIKRAFADYPLDSTEHALQRWVEIRKNGLDKSIRNHEPLGESVGAGSERDAFRVELRERREQ